MASQSHKDFQVGLGTRVQGKSLPTRLEARERPWLLDVAVLGSRSQLREVFCIPQATVGHQDLLRGSPVASLTRYLMKNYGCRFGVSRGRMAGRPLCSILVRSI